MGALQLSIGRLHTADRPGPGWSAVVRSGPVLVGGGRFGRLESGVVVGVTVTVVGVGVAVVVEGAAITVIVRE